jgi:hypothetical protein
MPSLVDADTSRWLAPFGGLSQVPFFFFFFFFFPLLSRRLCPGVQRSWGYAIMDGLVALHNMSMMGGCSIPEGDMFPPPQSPRRGKKLPFPCLSWTWHSSRPEPSFQVASAESGINFSNHLDTCNHINSRPLGSHMSNSAFLPYTPLSCAMPSVSEIDDLSSCPHHPGN